MLVVVYFIWLLIEQKSSVTDASPLAKIILRMLLLLCPNWDQNSYTTESLDMSKSLFFLDLNSNIN